MAMLENTICRPAPEREFSVFNSLLVYQPKNRLLFLSLPQPLMMLTVPRLQSNIIPGLSSLPKSIPRRACPKCTLHMSIYNRQAIHVAGVDPSETLQTQARLASAIRSR